jgi:hypothetical protein
MATGYSGRGDGLNRPQFQVTPDVGPIPRGIWEIGEPFDDPEHGAYCLPLTPQEGTELFGRSGFLCHGDEILNAGKHLASLGCIIMPRFAREQMWTNGDHLLEVVE